MLKDVGITDVNEMLTPPPGRRAGYAWEPGGVRQVLRDGNERANAIAPLPRGLFACGNTAAGQGWRNGIL